MQLDMPTTSPAVDAYIRDAQPFAKPILKKLRSLVHAACPDCTETTKWGFPHFDDHGMLCSMAAFKAHCAFGFWKSALLDEGDGVLETKEKSAMGDFGRIASLSDLPSDATIVRLVRKARALNVAGVKAPTARRRGERPQLAPPKELLAALDRSPAAKASFDGFSPSHRREYIEWILDAKTVPTREKRIATTIEWLTEGKNRNWKYERRGAAAKRTIATTKTTRSRRTAAKATTTSTTSTSRKRA
jgi:uncharacterized protein YdeI (YjbR/CyaY-like superfamily)